MVLNVTYDSCKLFFYRDVRHFPQCKYSSQFATLVGYFAWPSKRRSLQSWGYRLGISFNCPCMDHGTRRRLFLLGTSQVRFGYLMESSSINSRVKGVKMLFQWYFWAWWQSQWFASRYVLYSTQGSDSNIKYTPIMYSGLSGVSLWLSVTLRAPSLVILVCSSTSLATLPPNYYYSTRIFCTKRCPPISICCKQTDSIHCFLHLPAHVRIHHVCFFLKKSILVS